MTKKKRAPFRADLSIQCWGISRRITIEVDEVYSDTLGATLFGAMDEFRHALEAAYPGEFAAYKEGF